MASHVPTLSHYPILSREWRGAASGLITTLVLLALYVVFVRVADLD